jgi:hypothetical protein
MRPGAGSKLGKTPRNSECGRGEQVTAPPVPIILQFSDIGFAALELYAEAVPQAP